MQSACLAIPDSTLTISKSTTHPLPLRTESFRDTQAYHFGHEFTLNLINGTAYLFTQVKLLYFATLNCFGSTWSSIPPGSLFWTLSIFYTFFAMALLAFSALLSYCASVASGSFAHFILGYTMNADPYPEEWQRRLDKGHWRGLFIFVIPLMGSSIAVLLLKYNLPLLTAIYAGGLVGSLLSILISALSAIVCRIFVHSADFPTPDELPGESPQPLRLYDRIPLTAKEVEIEGDGDLERIHRSATNQRQLEYNQRVQARSKTQAENFKQSELQKQRAARARQRDVSGHRTLDDEHFDYEYFDQEYDPIPYNRLRETTPEIYGNLADTEEFSGNNLPRQQRNVQRESPPGLRINYREGAASSDPQDGTYPSSSLRDRRCETPERCSQTPTRTRQLGQRNVSIHYPPPSQNPSSHGGSTRFQSSNADQDPHRGPALHLTSSPSKQPSQNRRRVHYSNQANMSPYSGEYDEDYDNEISTGGDGSIRTPSRRVATALFGGSYAGVRPLAYYGTPVVASPTEVTADRAQSASAQPSPLSRRSSLWSHTPRPQLTTLSKRHTSSQPASSSHSAPSAQKAASIPRTPYATRLQVKGGNYAPPKNLFGR
jgi:hypothetical protein